MGDEQTRFGGLSWTPRIGVGLLTDGKLASFTGPFPQGATRFVGLEMAVDLDRIVDAGPRQRFGRLALLYYWGHATDSFSQDDLPLGDDPLLSLIRFSSQREANSHFALAEWRWPASTPLFRSPNWTLVRPEVGVGAGVFAISTQVRIGEEPPRHVDSFHFVATGSAAMRLVEFRHGDFQMGLTGGVRLFAGTAFGIMAESALTLAWEPGSSR